MNLNNTAVKPKNELEQNVIVEIGKTKGFSKTHQFEKFGVLPQFELVGFRGGQIVNVRNDAESYKVITLDQLIWESGVAPEWAVDFGVSRNGLFYYTNGSEMVLELPDLESKEMVKGFFTEVFSVISTRPQQEETKQYMPKVGEEYIVDSDGFALTYGKECVGKKVRVRHNYVSEAGVNVSVVEMNACGYVFVSEMLKPLKTKEEEEREEFVNNAITVVGCELENIPEVFARMFDNGCRFSAKLPKE